MDDIKYNSSWKYPKDEDKWDLYTEQTTERNRIIDNKMFVYSQMKVDGVCPFCASEIWSKAELREDILSLMRIDNELRGQIYHKSICSTIGEGNKQKIVQEWKV